ncbi:MAG: hypothetical protein A2408_01955 [Candidatus Yonathbacteria bacterium RIFOXYC1_FULL_52_10]|uniref:Uncharacterized protein n=1 Tax=Candidatus Yonathbacteria bacterium RIFOXYD1_FULL_52_36 TaxID=1802730 RepID=A0A1G2SMR8_9BACT|nr:MAG: hypothetical protein A2408_01955 [Candidatus Yonathbacteria bacterium RIFOXYC1_FULL_52_10]OHA86307.1 MAG: hypothetical protein A2591_01875 [Candidatus Yonathbacteria bacterium RIFOXYD1_FULL_52_36]
MTIEKFHPIDIHGIPANQELGTLLGRLRYDRLYDVLFGLREELIQQENSDFGRGRDQLAAALKETRAHLEQALHSMGAVTAICRIHIREEKFSRGE